MSEPRLREAPHNVWLTLLAQRPNKKTIVDPFGSTSNAFASDLFCQTDPIKAAVTARATWSPRGARTQSGPFPLHDVRYRAPSLAQARELFDRPPKQPIMTGSSTSCRSARRCNAGDVGKAAKRAKPEAAVVEPDGIEPTTSCLQSTRSPN
jgi:hypothetical protein